MLLISLSYFTIVFYCIVNTASSKKQDDEDLIAADRILLSLGAL